MTEYLSELTDVSLAAITTKLEKSSLIVSLKRDKQTHAWSHTCRVTGMHKINNYIGWHLRFQHNYCNNVASCVKMEGWIKWAGLGMWGDNSHSLSLLRFTVSLSQNPPQSTQLPNQTFCISMHPDLPTCTSPLAACMVVMPASPSTRSHFSSWCFPLISWILRSFKWTPNQACAKLMRSTAVL